MVLEIKRVIFVDIMFAAIGILIFAFVIYFNFYGNKTYVVAFFSILISLFAIVNIFANRTVITVDEEGIYFHPTLFFWKTFKCNKSAVMKCYTDIYSNIENDETVICFELDKKVPNLIKNKIRHPFILQDDKLYVYSTLLKGDIKTIIRKLHSKNVGGCRKVNCSQPN